MKKLAFIIAIISLTVSCKDKKNVFLPSSTGAAGEVVVVLNANLHHSVLSESIVNILSAEYPMLPQQEPWFKPHLVPEKAFTSVLKTHRNLILVRVGPEYPKPRITFQNNRWAKSQFVLIASGPDPETLTAYIRTFSERIREAIELAEIKRNTDYFETYQNRELKKKIQQTFGCTMIFPDGYKIRKATDQFIWISLETPRSSQGILVYTSPLRPGIAEPASLIQTRNEILKRYVPGSLPGTYMITSNAVAPEIRTLRQTTLPKIKLIQMRGLWEVHRDFMGGPFISQTIPDTLHSRCITLEAYVYAPRDEKRNLLRQTYSVLRTFQPGNPK